jgi:hypothetical protein
MSKSRGNQPGAIIRDTEKALELYKEANWDRFDDLCTTAFWTRLSAILLRELKKSIAREEQAFEKGRKQANLDNGRALMKASSEGAFE